MFPKDRIVPACVPRPEKIIPGCVPQGQNCTGLCSSEKNKKDTSGPEKLRRAYFPRPWMCYFVQAHLRWQLHPKFFPQGFRQRQPPAHDSPHTASVASAESRNKDFSQGRRPWRWATPMIQHTPTRAGRHTQTKKGYLLQLATRNAIIGTKSVTAGLESVQTTSLTKMSPLKAPRGGSLQRGAVSPSDFAKAKPAP